MCTPIRCDKMCNIPGIGGTGRTDSAAVKRREKPMMKRDPPTVRCARQGTSIGRPTVKIFHKEGKNKKDRGAGKSVRAPRLGCSWVLHPQHQR